MGRTEAIEKAKAGKSLADADLHAADLHGADLHGANLRGANLRGADLHGADLYGIEGGNMKLKVTVIPPNDDSRPQTFTVNGMEVLDQIARAVARATKETIRSLPIRRSPYKRSVFIEAQWVGGESPAASKK